MRPLAILTLSLLWPGLAAAQSGASLGPGDLIAVNVFGVPEVSGEFLVSENGKIAYPLLGEIDVVGMAPEAVSRGLTAGLKDGYIRDPKVSVVLLNQKEFSVRVIGEVVGAGSFSYKPGQGPNVLTVIGLAGGSTEEADLGGVEIRRAGKTIRAPLPASRNLMLQDGDVVIVPKLGLAGSFSIGGEVRGAGQYPIPRGTPLTIFSAINLAGGPTEAARLNKTKVRRRLPTGKMQEIEVDARNPTADYRVKDGDEIFLERRIF